MQELVEVAVQTGAGYDALRLAIMRGELRGERRGRRWFCDAADARRWKAERFNEPAPAA